MSEIGSDLPRHGLGCRALWPSGLDFLYQRFSSLFATKPFSSEASQAERWSGANHGSIGDSWPIAFSGYPRGPRVNWETACPRHSAPNLSAETRSRTRVSPEPDGHRWNSSRDRRTRPETLKLFVVSDAGRRSTPLSSTRAIRSWQFSWLRSDAPSPPASLWPQGPRRTLATDRACSRR